MGKTGKVGKKRLSCGQQFLILFLIGFLTYFSSLWNQFIWDDEQFIVKNAYVQQLAVGKIFTTNTIAGANHHSNYYRPLTTLSFAIDYQVWGLQPFGFHLTNTMLHLGAGVLVFLLLLSLLLPKITAFWISLFFIIHPLQTEAVVYANSRGDSLYAFWLLLGLVCFSISFRKKLPMLRWFTKKVQTRRLWWLIASLVGYALAILSKEIALAGVGLYGLVGLHHSWCAGAIRSGRIWSALKKIWPQLYTFFLIIFMAGVYLWLRATVLNFGNSFDFYEGEQNIYTQNLGVRLMTFSNTLWIYLRLLIVPFPLHMERTASIIEQINLATVGIIGLFAFLVWLGYHERKIKKTTWIWLGSLWFLVMLIPTSGILPINGLIYEHWLYLPMVGFWLVGYGLMQLINFPKKWKKMSQTVGVLVAAVMIVLTIRQNYLWAKPSRFYEYTLRFSQSARLYNNLGMAYANEGQLEKSIQQYQLAIELNPNYPQTYHNLGNSFAGLGEYKQAETAFQQALELDPNFIFSYPSLIDLYLKQQKYEESIQYLGQLIKFQPTHWQARLQLGQVLIKLGQGVKAEAVFKELLRDTSYHPKIVRAIEEINL